jgi:hypothetical protein
MSYYDPVTYSIIFGEVSATSAKHSPVQSSTIVRMRKQQLSANASDRKSRPQR